MAKNPNFPSNFCIEMPSCLNYVYEYAEEGPDFNLVVKLQKLLARKDDVYNSIIYDAAAHILALLVSDHDHYEDYIEDVRIHIEYIISNSLRSTRNLSDYTICVCLSRLLLVPGMTDFFVTKSGVLL